MTFASESYVTMMKEILENSRKASKRVAGLSSKDKTELLKTLAELVKNNAEAIKLENKKDLDLMDPADSKYDRLLLNDVRIASLVNALNNVAVLTDPVGVELLNKTLPNGLLLSKIAVPLGVIGIIYESRPNVTLDVASLCLRSGNAAILKGGKEAHFSNTILVGLIHKALTAHDLPESAVTLLPTNRTYTEQLLNAEGYVDVIIPRGSEGLINYVRANSKIPTIETGAGVCHTYVEKTADTTMGAAMIVNAKVTRPSVCNSLDCAIIDSEVLEETLLKAAPDLAKYQVELYADKAAFEILEKAQYPFLKKVAEEDYAREWLDFKASIKTVNGLDEALAHIEKYSSRHSEAIATANADLAQRFLTEVDAAAVYHNASTRFTDGEEFGLGAEIGISTQKLHARGPFALEKLVTEKWVIKGTGQIR